MRGSYRHQFEPIYGGKICQRGASATEGDIRRVEAAAQGEARV
ncbi:hypothetical protein COLO4_28814 [Corchorus olitorius]|uniref:Uncharacterized protein n=1 Tax=Corchorus olitorius TaxID=93759 RepID=A0A1R3HI67_9ROSI|nr:hypothetical protein COLO4_28814 [Corchorus olitorius]